MMKWKRRIYSFIRFCEIPLTNCLKFPKEKAKPTQILWKRLWKLLKKPVCFNHKSHCETTTNISCNSKELYYKTPHHNTNNQTKAQQATKRKLKPTCIRISHVPHFPQRTSRRKADNNKLTTHQREVKQHFEAFKLSGWFAKQKPNTKIHKYSLVKINHHYKPPNSKRHFQHPWTMGEPKDEMWSHTHTHTHMAKRKWQVYILGNGNVLSPSFFCQKQHSKSNSMCTLHITFANTTCWWTCKQTNQQNKTKQNKQKLVEKRDDE